MRYELYSTGTRIGSCSNTVLPLSTFIISSLVYHKTVNMGCLHVQYISQVLLYWINQLHIFFSPLHQAAPSVRKLCLMCQNHVEPGTQYITHCPHTLHREVGVYLYSRIIDYFKHVRKNHHWSFFLCFSASVCGCSQARTTPVLSVPANKPMRLLLSHVSLLSRHVYRYGTSWGTQEPWGISKQYL